MPGELPETYVDGWHDPDVLKKMDYRTMPKFGKVSVISFGASGLGGMFTAGEGSGLTDASASGGGSDAHWWQDDGDEARGRAREIVHMCLKAGVNLIDTSHWYGQGRSERLLGHALSDVPRAAYYITTKIGRYEKDALGMFDFSYEKTYQAALDSLKRLRLDCVDSMQIHDPEFCPSVDLLLEQTLPALQKLKEEGKVRFVGMTGYPLAVQQEIITRSGVGIDTSLSCAAQFGRAIRPRNSAQFGARFSPSVSTLCSAHARRNSRRASLTPPLRTSGTGTATTPSTTPRWSRRGSSTSARRGRSR